MILKTINIKSKSFTVLEKVFSELFTLESHQHTHFQDTLISTHYFQLFLNSLH